MLVNPEAVSVVQCAIQAGGSTLAAWFSGRWEDCLDRDAKGRTFLDFDPDLFQPILSFLRSSAISSDPDTRPPLVGIDATKQKAFKDLVKFLALEDYLGYTYDAALQPQLSTFAKASAEVTVSDDRQKATFSKYSQGYPIILVEPACSRCCYAKFKINSLGSRLRLFIGVGANFDVSRSQEQINTRTTYGWSCGHGGLFSICKGSATRTSEKPVFEPRCWVLVKADFTSQKLSMRTSVSDSSLDILLEVADDILSKYAFVLTLATYKDKVELLPVTPQDMILLP